MRLLLINPSCNPGATDMLRTMAMSMFLTNVEIASLCPATGPSSVDGYVDDAFSVPLVVEEARKAEHLGYNGIVIASIHDTGIDAVRSAVSIPVVGMCEASIHAASLLGKSFSVIVNVPRAVERVQSLVSKYTNGSRHCVSVRAVGVGGKPENQIRLAMIEDKAEVIVLGSTELCSQSKSYSTMFTVPCVNAVAVAIKALESLVSLGLFTSKIGMYALPGSEFRAEVSPMRAARIVSSVSHHIGSDLLSPEKYKSSSTVSSQQSQQQQQQQQQLSSPVTVPFVSREDFMENGRFSDKNSNSSSPMRGSPPRNRPVYKVDATSPDLDPTFISAMQKQRLAVKATMWSDLEANPVRQPSPRRSARSLGDGTYERA